MACMRSRGCTLNCYPNKNQLVSSFRNVTWPSCVVGVCVAQRQRKTTRRCIFCGSHLVHALLVPIHIQLGRGRLPPAVLVVRFHSKNTHILLYSADTTEECACDRSRRTDKYSDLLSAHVRWTEDTRVVQGTRGAVRLRWCILKCVQPAASRRWTPRTDGQMTGKHAKPAKAHCVQDEWLEATNRLYSPIRLYGQYGAGEKSEFRAFIIRVEHAWPDTVNHCTSDAIGFWFD